MVPEGHSLSRIQDMLKKEGVNITFMELRLIASELETEVWQKEDTRKEEERRKSDEVALRNSNSAQQDAAADAPSYPGNAPSSMAPGMGRGMGRLPEEDESGAEENMPSGMPPVQEEDPAEEMPQEQGGTTRVELSPIARPGAVASGTVTFGSGVTADWVLDRTGRIGLDNPTGSPTQQDIQEFQMELQKLFAR